MDVGPCRVEGAMRSQRARIIVSDGVVFVATARTHVRQFATAGEVRSVGVWSEVDVAGGKTLRWTRKGCPTCGWSLGRVPVDELTGAAQ